MRNVLRNAYCVMALSFVVHAVAQDTKKPDVPAKPELPTELEADRKPATQTGGNCLLRNFNILTAVGKDLPGGDVLVRNGKIAAIGKGLTAPAEVKVIEGNGRYLMPGIIDCHAHLAIDRGINEGTNPISAEVRIDEVVRATDVAIYRALAGGVTCAHLLHGSANVIGGQDAIVKMKYGRTPDEMLIPNMPRGIKFALGENVTKANFRASATTPTPFPGTRQGVDALLRRAFTEAREYQKQWDDYRKSAATGEDIAPPRKDVRLETLAAILRGEIRVHCHGYRADELHMLIRVADDFGWKIATFQHGLEAYKIASEIAKHGAGVSTFSDWWAYKFEAFDAIPYNAAILTRAGVVATINSDSNEQIRRLNLEAAKSLRYGQLTDTEALRLCTLNAAIQLGIADRTGSIEVGKDADLALFAGHPLSAFSRCEMTLVDGEVFFERNAVFPKVEAASHEVVIRRAELPVGNEKVTIISGAMIHPITRPDVVHGTIVLSGSRIISVLQSGERFAVPRNATTINATGLHVYPGMIDGGASTGLSEVASIDGTNDLSELGLLQPDLVAGTALNPASDHIPVTRVSGITTSLVRMTGGRVCGQASLFHLNGFTLEEMTVNNRCALVINYPSFFGDGGGRGGGGFFAAPPTEISPAARAAVGRELDRIRDLFKQAREYEALKKDGAAPAIDTRLEAMIPYLRGECPVIIRATTHAQLVGAIKLIEELKVKGIIAGATEGWKVADELAAKKIPVIVGRVLTLPLNEYDPYDAPYANAAQLVRAGVKIAFQSDDVEHARNLPFNAAMAVAYGLPHDEALRALTINAAEVFGVGDRLGSLEVGKLADLVVTDGDPMEIRTQVKHLFIAGQAVSLETRHTRLRDTYMKRIQEPRK